MKKSTEIILEILFIVVLLLINFVLPGETGGQIAVKAIVGVVWIVGAGLLIRYLKKKNRS